MKRIELKKNHLIKNSQSYIVDYLGTLGIAKEDVPSFINQPRNSDEEDPLNLENIQQGIQVFYNNIQANGPIFIQVDADTDGYTSASILYNYIHRRWPHIEVTWRLHHSKEHGVIVDTVPENTKLVIIPDAGSNQFDEQAQLVALGKQVIVLDHHEVTETDKLTTTPAIIINNQISPRFKNKSLSGAGVVYKFIKQLDRQFFPDNPIYQDYGDLAAIGIIADAMNMTTLDNNYIAYYGLSHIHSKFIHALALRQERGIKNPESLTKIDVAFYIAPVINGVIRSGAPEDKEAVFHALTDENNTDVFTRVWRGVTYTETLYEYAARLAANAKSRQDASKKKSFEWLCEKIKKEHWDHDNLIIATLDAKESLKVSPNITGLIAMELVKEFNRPCLVLRETEYDNQKMYGGSGRNGNFYGLPDLKAMLHQAGAYYGEGHANAFGAYLLPTQIQTIRDYFNEHLMASVFDDLVYEVDYWFHTGERIDSQMLMNIAEFERLWGNSIPQPKFAFSLTVMPNQIKFMGKDNSSVRITVDGVDFVAFKNQELIDLIQQNTGLVHIDFVGRAQINEWMGNRKVQVIIDDFTVFQPATQTTNLSSLI